MKRIDRPHPMQRALAAAAASAIVWAAGPAHAGDAGMREPLLPRYREECSACHLAYPPHLLPAASWQRLMSSLPKHFGSDASLDAATAAPISAWLQAHAAGERRPPAPAAPPADRITRTAWFAREHDDVGAATWARPGIRSPSHCAACHPRAEQGVFDEHDIRIPR